MASVILTIASPDDDILVSSASYRRVILVSGVEPLIGELGGELPVQRQHQVEEVEAEDELEAVRGHGEGQRGEVQPHGLAHQDSDEHQRLQRGQKQPNYQVVRPPRLSEIMKGVINRYIAFLFKLN